MIANKKAHKPTDVWHLNLPRETQNYLPRLLSLAASIDHAIEADWDLPNILTQAQFEIIQLPNSTSLKKVAQFSGVPLNTLRQFNPGFRRWETGPEKTYTLLIPIQKVATLKSNFHLLTQHKPYVTYVVKNHDTISTLAKRYHTTGHVIQSLNHLKNTTIHRQQLLYLPHPPSTWPTLSLVKRHFHRLIRSDHLPGPRHKTYQVKKGDTLVNIAKKTHLHVQQIRFWNHLSSRQSLQPGQILHFWKPSSHHDSRQYHVKSGDSLYRIARRFHTDARRIERMNYLKKRKIYAGQILRLPATVH